MTTTTEAQAPLLLTRRQTADLLNVSVSTVKRLTKAGELQSKKVGRLVRFPRAVVERFAAGDLAIAP